MRITTADIFQTTNRRKSRFVHRQRMTCQTCAFPANHVVWPQTLYCDHICKRVHAFNNQCDMLWKIEARLRTSGRRIYLRRLQWRFSMHRKSELPQNLPRHQLGNKECRKAVTVVRYLYQMEYRTKLDLTLNQISPSSSSVLLPIVVSPNFSAATSSAILAPLSAAVGIPNECWMSSVKREILLSWNASPYNRYSISTTLDIISILNGNVPWWAILLWHWNQACLWDPCTLCRQTDLKYLSNTNAQQTNSSSYASNLPGVAKQIPRVRHPGRIHLDPAWPQCFLEALFPVGICVDG